MFVFLMGLYANPCVKRYVRLLCVKLNPAIAVRKRSQCVHGVNEGRAISSVANGTPGTDGCAPRFSYRPAVA